ncbi:uncharacterized protein Pyn_28059 [Prunus yedoensis var. nudiflora]|uniref:Uncharacterized protein n=1 Tax=Prunus yedoensis var. nudiflora TaxID=2094558 RepID=A0A314UK62_PRUYE|nr:uncharacterized protein Pyn_28059 [Prunus yedoensis var. nudiflora]
MSQANIDYGESFNEIHDDLFSQVDENRYGSYSLGDDHLFQEERSALYHGEPQDFYDVLIHTNDEYEYDGDGDDKTKGFNSEESDNDGNNSDSEFYDEDNDAMLDDDNFYDDAVDTLQAFIGCDKLHSASNSDEEGNTRRYKEFNIDTDMDNPQFDVGMKFPSCLLSARKVVSGGCMLL